jgi:hypothetical protein
MIVTEGRLAELENQVIERDRGVRTAEEALSEYLSAHPNAHAAFRTGNRFTVRLDAMHADPFLSGLEHERDKALLQFHAALLDFANAKGGSHGNGKRS